jgi:hypothetical protein
VTHPLPGSARGIPLIAVLVVAACADGPHGLLAGTTSPPPPEIRDACALATHRCAHCHPIERVMVSRGIGVERWAMYVEQMRLKPSSGISPSEAAVILQCLKFIETSLSTAPRADRPAPHPLASIAPGAPGAPGTPAPECPVLAADLAPRGHS